VFAYAVLKLIEQGKLALDAPVMRYLPQGYRHRHEPLNPEPSELVSDARLGAVTVRMLLNHTSGLPNWASGPLTFKAAPGTEWHYSGEGYLLLQRAVEAVTGQPLDQFMATAVFAPLGMRHSSFVWNEDIAHDLLPGTEADGSAKTTVTIAAPIAAFSLHTSAADYGKFLAAVLNDDAVRARITASAFPADRDQGIDWGLGWGIEKHPDDRIIWQWGNNPGYRGFVIASVQRRDGFVMLTNSDNGLVLARPMTQAILGGEHRLFRSSILGTDLVSWLCKTVGLCL
jgi:CubicO group peptidase (beta-lactamase class C family)